MRLFLLVVCVVAVRADCVLVGCDPGVANVTDCDTCGAVAAPELADATWLCQNITGTPQCHLQTDSVSETAEIACNRVDNNCCRPDSVFGQPLPSPPPVLIGLPPPPTLEELQIGACQAKNCSLAVACNLLGQCEYDDTVAHYESCCDTDDDCPLYAPPFGNTPPGDPFVDACTAPRCTGDRQCTYLAEVECCATDADCVSGNAQCGVSTCNTETNECERRIDLNCECTLDVHCYVASVSACAAYTCDSVDTNRCVVTALSTGLGTPPPGCCNTEFAEDATQCVDPLAPCQRTLGCSYAPMVSGSALLAPTFVCEYDNPFDGTCCTTDAHCEPFATADTSVCLAGTCNSLSNTCAFVAEPPPGVECCQESADCSVQSDLCDAHLCVTDAATAANGTFLTCELVPVPSCTEEYLPPPGFLLSAPSSVSCEWECALFPVVDPDRNVVRGGGVLVENPADEGPYIAYAWGVRVQVIAGASGETRVTSITATVDAVSREAALPALGVDGPLQSGVGVYTQDFVADAGADSFPLYPGDTMTLSYAVRFQSDVDTAVISVEVHLIVYDVCQLFFYGAPDCAGPADDGVLLLSDTFANDAAIYDMSDAATSFVDCPLACVDSTLAPPPPPSAAPTPPTPAPTVMPTFLPPTPLGSPTPAPPPLPALAACCGVAGCTREEPASCDAGGALALPQTLSCNVDSCTAAMLKVGFVWLDANADGVRQLGEAGDAVRNVRIELVSSGGAVVADTLSDTHGRYAFNGTTVGASPSVSLYSLRVDPATIPFGLSVSPIVPPFAFANVFSAATNETETATPFSPVALPQLYYNLGLRTAPPCEPAPLLSAPTRTIELGDTLCDACFDATPSACAERSSACDGAVHRAVVSAAVTIANHDAVLADTEATSMHVSVRPVAGSVLLCSAGALVNVTGSAADSVVLLSVTDEGAAGSVFLFAWQSLPAASEARLEFSVAVCSDALPSQTLNVTASVWSNECVGVVHAYDTCADTDTEAERDVRRCRARTLVSVDADNAGVCAQCGPTPAPVPTVAPTRPPPSAVVPRLVLGDIAAECAQNPLCVNKDVLERFGCADVEAAAAQCAEPARERGLAQWTVTVENRNATQLAEAGGAVRLTVDAFDADNGTTACRPLSVLVELAHANGSVDAVPLEVLGADRVTPLRVEVLVAVTQRLPPGSALVLRVTVLICDVPPLQYALSAAVETQKCAEFAATEPHLCRGTAPLPDSLLNCTAAPECPSLDGVCNNEQLAAKFGDALRAADGGTTAALVATLVVVSVCGLLVLMCACARLKRGRRRRRGPPRRRPSQIFVHHTHEHEHLVPARRRR